MKTTYRHYFIALALLTFASIGLQRASAQGTAFTYQGQLQNNGIIANGSYDLSFSVFNVASGGSAVAGPIMKSATGVTNGLFTVTLDFGPGLFTGTNYWLDINVRTNGGATFTELSPRQALTPTPYAIMANSASNLLGILPASQVGSGTAAVNISGSAASFTGSLSGDVTGTQSATVVSKVGGVTAADVVSGANAANAATPLNTASTIVKRDVTGSFNAQSITLAGNLNLPTTTATVGAININGSPFLHGFGNQDVFVGDGAGNFAMTGMFNTGVGYDALFSDTTGLNNTAVGDGALWQNTGGSQNTAMGTVALLQNTVGSDNTAIGYAALLQNIIGSNNVAVGSEALQNNTNGLFNTALGWHALHANLDGSFNVAVGEDALSKSTIAGFNVAVGGEALFADTTGGANTAVGDQALFSDTTGSYNTALGNQALFSAVTSSQNTAVGSGALFSDTTGSNNTATGFSALGSNGGGRWNLADGWEALTANTSGSYNVACGGEALIANISGSMSVAVGEEALFTETSGGGNTGIGNQALYGCTGNFNTALGAQAGQNLTSGDFNIDIGSFGAAGDTNTIRIGEDSNQSRTFIAAIYGSTSASGIPVYVNSNGRLGTLTSSARFKKDIKNMGDASDVLLSLRPVTFRYKPEIDPDGNPQFGLVAEEVEKVDPELVAHDAQGKIYTVRYEAVNAMLLNEFLKEHRTVTDQESRIENLKQQNASLADRLQQLEATVKALAAKSGGQ